MPALRVFDAAARHGSFTAASEELGMTQAAVSYQIKVLEDRVGAPLFERQARGVRLTPLGADFAETVIATLDLLRDAFAEVRGSAQKTLKLNVLPTFATSALSTSLRGFQQLHPDIQLRMEISENSIAVDAVDCDMAIRLGPDSYMGSERRLLFRAMFTPMVAPGLIEAVGGLSTPADLLKLPILSLGDPRWPLWLAAAGVADHGLAPDPAQHFGPQMIEAQAAVDGHGIAMLTPTFFQRELFSGALVQPFDLLASDGNSYWLVNGQNRSNSTKIRIFRNWILRQTARYRAEDGTESAD